MFATYLLLFQNFAQRLVNADRASLFLVDHKGNELYARIFDVGTTSDEALNLDSSGQKEIRHAGHTADATTLNNVSFRFPMDKGIAGYVASTG